MNQADSMANNQSSQERIAVLDFLRGLAIFGILFINIESFAYPNPWSAWQYGYESSLDQQTRFWVYLFTQGKFYSMFALLFGVGFVLFLEKVGQKVSGLEAIDIYARRLFWLFVIGVVHSYFLWDGDILHHYAICGFLLLPFRSMKNTHLLILVGVLAGLLLAKSYHQVADRIETHSRYTQALDTAATERTSKQQDLIDWWERRYSPKEPIRSQQEAPKATYWQGVKEAYSELKIHKGSFFFSSLIISSLMVMTIGILLYRTGIFSDYRRWKHYWLITLGLLLSGLAINGLRYYQWTFLDHLPVLQVWKALVFTLPKEWLGVAYVLLLNGLYQVFLKKVKLDIVSAIGRTALSNYLLQSLILGILFYGYGLGLHNQYSRFELLAFIPAIWLLQLILTLGWLKYFPQGPAEGLWKKLTYRAKG